MTDTPNLNLIYCKITSALAILLEHMHKKFEMNRTKIKGGCQSRRKVVTHNSKSDLPLVLTLEYKTAGEGKNSETCSIIKISDRRATHLLILPT